ncbi:MAG: acyltransferase 3 [Bryobacterales bacterium]|nr:acyltransferase 3 [Bryobacterales bacterium]
MRRIPLLDGWRAVAIALVLVHHVAQGFYPAQDSYGADITRYGAFGVDIFFALSGLLITRLLLEEWNTTGSFQLRQFYVRRTFRILPPVLVFLAVYTAAGQWKSTMEAISSLLFFRNYVPSRLTGFGTGHLWSLAIEEHFYLIWPGLLAFLGPRRSRHAAAWLALGFGLWRMIESQYPVPLFAEVPAHFRTDLRLDALLWGCVTAFLLNGAKEWDKLARQTRLPYWLAAVAITIWCVRYYSPLTSVAVAVLIPAILAGTLVHPNWWISRALNWGPLAWLGRISYSLYLWQELFMTPGWEPATQWWRHWPWNLLASLAAATLSYYMVEKPVIRLGRQLAAGLSKNSTGSVDLQVQRRGDQAQPGGHEKRHVPAVVSRGIGDNGGRNRATDIAEHVHDRGD